MLAVQRLDMESTPADRQKVRLATVPKVATGGEARPVDLSTFHPDNVSAARRAVQLTRLDVAGVDFITTDPGRSWRETGGVITEINARPQINRFEGSSIHNKVIRALVEGDGRIPSVLLLARSESTAALLSKLADQLGALAGSTGIVTPDPSACGDSQSKFAAITTPDGTSALMTNQSVLCVVTVAPIAYLVSNGVPFHRFDLSALLEPSGSGDFAKFGGPLLQPHLSGKLLVHGKHKDSIALTKYFPMDTFEFYQNEDDLFCRVAQFISFGLETPDIVTSGQGLARMKKNVGL